MESMYDELLSRYSNSCTLADCAKAAPTACRSRYCERSYTVPVLVIVVTVCVCGDVTTVVVCGTVTVVVCTGVEG